MEKCRFHANLCVSGAATVKIAMPSHMQGTLIFHYNLKFYDSDGDTFESVSLKRFVMQVRRIRLLLAPSITVLLPYSVQLVAIDAGACLSKRRWLRFHSFNDY